MTADATTTPTKRPNLLVALFLLCLVIAGGAHVSGAPVFVVKVLTAVMLFGLYGFFAVRIFGALRIGSAKVRGVLGFVLGAATVYLTWAVRIPAFAGWEVPFTADPRLVLDAILERASSLEVSSGFGAGTTTEGPSWLMLGTYILEAVAFAGVMVLCALLTWPEKAEGAGAGEAASVERKAA